ncbi:pyridoxal 5'-phosphate synthase, partial [Akkermansiaceae bacterium]|nr:pyridoxal 5'-phosphate synthase [Akkermansiaceae bacterium]
MNLGELRENYAQSGIEVSDMEADPFLQFEQWMIQAQEAQIIEPNAMTLSTSNASGDVSSRTVLLKGLENGGFEFFTNYDSHKGQDLASHPKAALTFLWKELERQVCVQGVVEKTCRETSEQYFHSRPYGSQIGAWVSEKQSGAIPD